MRYKIKGRAKLTWADKDTDSPKSKYQDITEYFELEEKPTIDKARNLVENLEAYQTYMIQWITMIEVSEVD